MDTKTTIMRAAMELAEARDNVHGVTISLESVADRAGLTKPGLMYHYPSKEALMEGLVDYASRRWTQLLAQDAGGEACELSVWDRYRAYVRVATLIPHSRADYWVLSDTLYHPTLLTGWRQHMDPWLDTTGITEPACSLLTSARFLADGAWISAATNLVTRDTVTQVAPHGLALIEQAKNCDTTHKGKNEAVGPADRRNCERSDGHALAQSKC